MAQPGMEDRLDAGLSEIVRFLAQRPPFSALAPDELAAVAAEAAIEFFPRGAVILSEDGGPVTFLRVIHSGGVDISHEGRLLDLLAPGDTFGHAAMLSGLPPGFEATAAEDTLCYRIPVTVARPVLDRARSRELQVGTTEAHAPVAKLIRSPTVTCKPSESIGTVAERMTRAGATAAVVQIDDGTLGIVTDRDLRSRVLAVGRNGGARIDLAMTAPVYTVGPERLGGEVLYEMLERGIRHVPVVSERGRLVGVLEDADLFAAQPRSWFGTRRAISRARSLDQLAEQADRLPGLMLELHRSSVPALELAPVLSALVDALTSRALELVAAQTPVPDSGVVWVGLGSLARRELTPASVRRGAVVYGSKVSPPTEWLEAVGQALVRCGIEKPVPANDALGWISAAGTDEVAQSVLADRRVLWGTPAEPLPVALGDDRTRLLDALAAHAFTQQPPTGFDADAVLTHTGRHSRLNIRSAAIVPIAAIARWAAASAASGDGAISDRADGESPIEIGQGSTPGRLRAAADAGVLREPQAQTLSEAFNLALELRIVHQLEQLARDEEPDDLLDPRVMSQLTRDHLRGAFRAVSGVVRDLRP